MEEIKEKADYCLNCPMKPCKKGCPLGNNIPDFIKKVKEDKYEEAYNVLLETTILQPICGRICPHEKQCQGNCVRGIKSNPVSIGELEAFVGDMALKNGYKISKGSDNHKKIAVVGGGPAGITAAAFLARYGYNVTIYEKHSQLGGLLRHGIPNFRLKKDLLDKYLDKIVNELDIKVIYNKELNKDYKIKDLCSTYDAIFLSFGANISKMMNIPGEDLEGVFGGNELLEKNIHPDYTNKKVAVIGGGNVAMDTARIVKNLGAKEVKVIYRRAEEQMPAEKKEIKDAKKEGIEFLFLNNILKINGNSENKVCSIECIKTQLVNKEGERPVPVNIEGSNYILDIDYVVMALGSEPENEILSSLGIELKEKGYIKVNDKYQTSNSKIFAGGDLIGTKSTVAWAAFTGREAAKAIDSIIKNDE